MLHHVKTPAGLASVFTLRVNPDSWDGAKYVTFLRLHGECRFAWDGYENRDDAEAAHHAIVSDPQWLAQTILDYRNGE